MAEGRAVNRCTGRLAQEPDIPDLASKAHLAPKEVTVNKQDMVAIVWKSRDGSTFGVRFVSDAPASDKLVDHYLDEDHYCKLVCDADSEKAAIGIAIDMTVNALLEIDPELRAWIEMADPSIADLRLTGNYRGYYKRFHEVLRERLSPPDPER